MAPDFGVVRPTLTGTPSLLRAINERAVLELMRRRGAISRAQVARELGLSKPTVSLTLAGLVDAGLALQIGQTRGAKGPSALLYELNPMAGAVVGVDVGRQWVRAAAADITGAILARHDERAQARSARTLIEQVVTVARAVAADAAVEWRFVKQVVVGSPGVFDPGRGTVTAAYNLPGWSRHGLVEALQEQLGPSVVFENDVNLAALSELAHGNRGEAQSFVYLSVGTGIGAGIVLDGRLVQGAHGAAGEVAYLPLGSRAANGRHRRGLFEENVGADAVVRRALAFGMSAPLTAKKVFDAARRGEPAAQKAVVEEARAIAFGIAGIASVIDPEVVVLGGGIGRNGDLLLEPIRRELAGLQPFLPRIEVSALGDDAVVLGAVTAALAEARERVFSRG